ncbi:Fc receptor-like protein 5 [Brachyhypopomus gauderio]|uniref:Fc receptor-like protein 5 n=1 Tax=Brachyhypopomus gauderio TaxID=698409 RepID=UPI004042E7E1
MELSPLPVMLLLISVAPAGTVEERPQAVLSVSPQSWLTEGVSVTLSCEVRDSSTGWTFSWYRVVPYREGLTPIDINGDLRYGEDLLSDSSRGAGVSYTLSPAALHHTGVYVCRAERGEPANQTQYSNPQPLWITGLSPPVSLIISPNRTQHFIVDSLTLSCEGQSDSTGWRVRQYTHCQGVSDCSSVWGSVTGSTCTISFLFTCHTGVYWCQSESGGSSNPVNITVHSGNVILESPVNPVIQGDPLTLHCLLYHPIPPDFRSDFYKDGLLIKKQTTGKMTIYTVSKSDEGFYYCKHTEREVSPNSWVSITGRPQAVLSVSPQSWLTEGVSVTLSCEVRDSSTGWTFSWYRVVPYREDLTPKKDTKGYMMYGIELLSDSSRGAGVSYTLSPAALHHTGVYVCRAERGEPAYQTQYSDPQPLWITGSRPPGSLIISPNRTQHFSGDSLTLSCEGQNESTGWRVIRYRHRWSVSNCSTDWGSVTGSTCTIRSLFTSHTGVYWCQSESGRNSNPVNITVHNGSVILESPVHPVTEGDHLTLHCLLHPTDTSDLRADLYKDGLLIQNQTAGEMTIHNVSKSDEGLYHCKHPERGESPHSWISVRARSHSEAPFSALRLLSSLLVSSPFLLISIVLGVKCYRAHG